MVRVATDADVLPISLVARLTLEDTYQELLNDEVQSKFIEDFYNPSIIQGLVSNQQLLVVENEEQLMVGFLSLIMDGDQCEIVSLYILPKYQGLGYGSSLVSSLMDNQQIKVIITDLESRNIPTQKFYTHHGFTHEISYPQDLYGQPVKLMRFRWERTSQ